MYATILSEKRRRSKDRKERKFEFEKKMVGGKQREREREGMKERERERRKSVLVSHVRSSDGDVPGIASPPSQSPEPRYQVPTP